MDVPRHEVSVGGKPVELTPREFELLKVPLSQSGRVVTAGRLLGVAVGSDAERERFVAQGANWVVQGSDQALLRQAAAALRPSAQASATRAS